MYEELVKLVLEDVSQGATSRQAYFMMLREAEGNRRLSAIIGPYEAQSLLAFMRKIQVSRPLPHDSMLASLMAFDIGLREVVIYKVRDGVYYSKMVLIRDGVIRQVEARTSDAVALALRYDAPIFTYESLLARERIYEGIDGAISIPVSSLRADMLREALKRAISEENYELAAQLRDELARREHEE